MPENSPRLSGTCSTSRVLDTEPSRRRAQAGPRSEGAGPRSHDCTRLDPRRAVAGPSPAPEATPPRLMTGGRCASPIDRETVDHLARRPDPRGRLVIDTPSRDHGGVQKIELVAGRKYALLRARGNQLPTIDRLVKVRYLGRAHRNQISIGHEGGPLMGLQEWVRTRELACAWSDRGAFLRDHRRSAQLAENDSQVGDRVTDSAISAVLTASGEYTGFSRPWTSSSDSAARLWARAGLTGSPMKHR